MGRRKLNMKAFRIMGKKRITAVAAITLTLCLALLAACGKTAHISGLIVGRDIDDLCEKSSPAVIGTVSGQSEAFQIEHVAGGTANFTDYYFTVESTLRGKAETETVTIRVQGGIVDGYSEVFSHSPDLKEGEEYLIFLYRPGCGGAYNTEGDYYYVLGLTQGVFTRTESGDFLSMTGVELTNDRLLATINKTPVNENYFREEYIQNQKGNLSTGFITQEEYDYAMENIDVYAKIVEK